ncbi:hypothetical protein [Streptomyces sp. Wb2n-11]|uniref:hypothetical protein n=1 Tax=Streptomyces sp. Wb2n-11 TaxID=1030533 RepID=UPI000B2A4073|nr:hypothetical protein [Streptomyces sp. Wb2n-11]
MHKRLPVLALCLTLAFLGTSACDDSGDNRSRVPAPSASAADAPSEASREGTPAGSSEGPAGPRRLTGVLAELYLKTIRDNYPDMTSISDEALLIHGNAFCAAQGVALADRAKKTMKELGTTSKQTAQIMISAHGYCRWLYCPVALSGPRAGRILTTRSTGKPGARTPGFPATGPVTARASVLPSVGR